MTQDQIILAVVSAAVGVAAKGFFEWILTIVSKLSVVENFKEKLKTIFTKQNISISIDFISGLFFIGVLVKFGMAPNPATGLDVLIILGSSFMLFIYVFSFLWKIHRAKELKIKIDKANINKQ
ncbi:MAG: hypothetical protein Q7K26_05110 [bacterium]|nr:hypothetical protein [bacterium]